MTRSFFIALLLGATCIRASSEPVLINPELLQAVPEHTHSLRLLVTALVQKIETGALKQVNKQEFRVWALNVQRFFAKLQEKAGATIADINLKVQLHAYFITLLQQALEHNCTQLPQPHPEPIIEQALTKEVDIPTMERIHGENSAALTHLESVMRNLGLTRLNRVTRATEQFFKKFNIFSLIKGAIFVGSGAWLFKHFSKSQEPRISPHRQPIVPSTAWFSPTTREFISQVTTGAVGYAGIQLGQQLVHQSKDALYAKWIAAQKTVHSLWDYLKGQSSVLDLSGYKIIDNSLTLDSDELIGLEEQTKQISPLLQCAVDLEGFIARGNKPQYGILLVGPSGCGKTQFARALSGTLKQIFDVAGKTTPVYFREINCWEFRFHTLRSFIAEARKQGGVVVLFIDEIHNLEMQTTRSTSALNEFLTQMLDLYTSNDPQSHVFIVAATNQPELLGTSLLVPGRFGTVITFNYPTIEKRRQLFQTLLPQSGINPQDIDIETLVRQTSKEVSFAKLRAVITEARIKAGNHTLVSQEHLQAAVDMLIHRFTHTTDLTAAEQKAVAAYQAGKILVHELLELPDQIERATIGGIKPKVQEINEFTPTTGLQKHNPNKKMQHTPRYGKIMTYQPHELVSLSDQQTQEKQAHYLLAGSEAQTIVLGNPTVAYRPKDAQRAYEITQQIIMGPLKVEQLSQARQDEVKNNIEKRLALYQQEVRTLLQKESAALKAIAHALQERITLSGAEIRKLIEEHRSSQAAAHTAPA